jgi:hypothetical protein
VSSSSSLKPLRIKVKNLKNNFVPGGRKQLGKNDSEQQVKMAYFINMLPTFVQLKFKNLKRAVS